MQKRFGISWNRVGIFFLSTFFILMVCSTPSQAADNSTLNGTYTVYEIEKGFHGPDPYGGWGANDQIWAMRTDIVFDGNGGYTSTFYERELNNHIWDTPVDQSAGDDQDFIYTNAVSTSTSACTETDSGTYTVNSDGTVTISTGDDGDITVALSADGNTLLFGEGEFEGESMWCAIDAGVGVKRGIGMSEASLSGTYTVYEFENGFHGGDVDAWGVNDYLCIIKTTFVFDGAGNYTSTFEEPYLNNERLETDIDWSVDGDQDHVRSNIFTTTYSPDSDTETGTYTVDSDGNITVYFDGGAEAVPGVLSADGRTLVLGNAEYDNANRWGAASLGVGVKRGTGMSTASLQGTFAFGEIDSGFHGPDPNGGWGSNDELCYFEAQMFFDGAGNYYEVFNDFSVNRWVSEIWVDNNPGEPGDGDQVLQTTMLTTSDSDSGMGQGTYSVASDGTVTLSTLDDGDVTAVLSGDGKTLIFAEAEYNGDEYWCSANMGVGVKQPSAFDFGDAPDPTYPTLLASSGAQHTIVPGYCLGSAVDAESDGQPDANALGDDTDGNDDEDGVIGLDALAVGTQHSVTITASGSGYIDAWIDFNGDGDWADAGEQIFTSQAVTTGANNLSFSVPGDATLGQTYARFRFSSIGGLYPVGLAQDGEVEDCKVEIYDAKTIYEDAEDGLIDGWVIYDDDPAASVTNVDDGTGNLAIELDGSGTANGYRLRLADGITKWNNTTQFLARWRMNYSEWFTVYFDCETTSGHRFIYYNPSASDDLGSGEYIHYGLGDVRGDWHEITRNLAADLDKAQPGNTITTVNGVYIRGSGMMDDIALWLDTDGDGLSDWDENACGSDIGDTDSDDDGLTDGDEVNIYKTNPTVADSDGDGISDGAEVSAGSDPGDAGSTPYGTIYEDAEDGLIAGWVIYDNDPAASVTNVDDGTGNLAIELDGSGTANGYRLRLPDGVTKWNNTTQFLAKWRMNYSEWFTVYFDCETTSGHRFIYYNPSTSDTLGSGEYIHYGLGAEAENGSWHTFIRDLAADLDGAQPGNTITTVNGIYIRGSGMVDDIELWPDTDTDSDADGLTDGDEVNIYQTDPTVADSDGDGTNDGEEVLFGYDPADPDSNPDYTLYEDAEDGLIAGWVIYDNDPAASVTNVDDGTGNLAIELSGSGTANGYRLRLPDGTTKWNNQTQFCAQWRMNYSEWFTIYFDCETTSGHRFIYYNPAASDDLGSGEYIHHGLGDVRGAWHEITRDLAADLDEAQSGNTITAVNGVYIRGSGLMDDIRLLAVMPE